MRAEHLREPEVGAREDAEHRAAITNGNAHDEVGAVQLDVRRGLRRKNPLIRAHEDRHKPSANSAAAVKRSARRKRADQSGR